MLVQDDEMYRILIGMLMYLTMTQPGISFAVQHLVQFMQQPKDSHYADVLKVIRYVMDKPGQMLFYSAKNENKLRVYCDFD